MSLRETSCLASPTSCSSTSPWHTRSRASSTCSWLWALCQRVTGKAVTVDPSNLSLGSDGEQSVSPPMSVSGDPVCRWRQLHEDQGYTVIAYFGEHKSTHFFSFSFFNKQQGWRDGSLPSRGTHSRNSQGRNMEPWTAAEVMQECCSLVYPPWLAQPTFFYNPELPAPGMASLTVS